MLQHLRQDQVQEGNKRLIIHLPQTGKIQPIESIKSVLFCRIDLFSVPMGYILIEWFSIIFWGGFGMDCDQTFQIHALRAD